MGFTSNPDKITLYMHKNLVQIDNTKCVQNVDMRTIQMKAASVVAWPVFPFVQCGLVAPLVVDGSPDSVSPLVAWGLMVSQVVGLVIPFAVRSCVGLGWGICSWPQHLGPAPYKSTC